MERTVGLLGGGQLGQMLCEAANPLGVKVIILDVGHSPAKQVNAKNDHLDGSFTDAAKIRDLARQCDILTVEIEHVDTHVLEEIAETGVEVVVDGKKVLRKVEVQPSWKTLRVIQDKFLQKQHLISNGVAVAKSVAADAADLTAVGSKLGYPFMLKARKDAYDGRGNFPVKSASDIPEALDVLKNRSLYAEKWARFKMELAVMVVKTSDGSGGDTIAYPAFETIHEDSICKLVYAPARGVSQKILKSAQELARKAVSSLWGKGVFCVELFLMDNDTIVVNEIAPRPHNSAHLTIEAIPTLSQFKSQLLSILGLMPSGTSTIPLTVPAAIMLNILGGSKADSHNALMAAAVSLSNASLHMYGKASKPARKIGHITIIGSSMAEAERSVQKLIGLADTMRAERKFPGKPAPTPSTVVSFGKHTGRPTVAITMGSDSDMPKLTTGMQLLEDFGIPYHVDITSAHRTPKRMMEFAEGAVEAGFKVIIAAAGGAAHLPGMIAGSTPLPVIGVPIQASVLDGLDSLFSIVQMPRGVPVATVSINGGLNAALLAARILGASDEGIRQKVEEYSARNEAEVIEKAERLNLVGWKQYLAKK